MKQLVGEEGPTSIHRSSLLQQWGRMEDGPGQEVNIYFLMEVSCFIYQKYAHWKYLISFEEQQ